MTREKVIGTVIVLFLVGMIGTQVIDLPIPAGDKIPELSTVSVSITDVIIDNKKAKKIMFIDLKENINISKEAKKLNKKPKELLNVKKTKYYGDVEIKLKHYVNVTTNQSYSCNCRNETTEYPTNLTNGTEAYNLTQWVCDTCYKDVTNLVFKEIDPETFILRNNEPIYEIMESSKKFEKMPDGWGYAVWTDVNIMGVKVEGATWWNATFEKKKEIQIDNNDLEVANYSLLLNVSYDSDMSAGFEDIRFANGSENEALSYWIENKVDGLYADVWVKIPYTLTNTTNTTIYMYYDNDSVVSSESDIKTAFPIGDDFNDASIDTDIWYSSKQGSAGATVEETGGYLHLEGDPGVISSAALTSKTEVTYDFIWEFRRKQETHISYQGWAYGGGDIVAYDGGTTDWWFSGIESGYFISHGIGGLSEMAASGGYSVIDASCTQGLALSTWTDFRIEYNHSGVIKQYLDDALDCSHSDSTFLSNDKNVSFMQGEYSNGAGGDYYVDWTYVRKHLATTPTYSFGAEEEMPDTTAPTVSWNYPADDTFNTSRTFNVGFTPHDETALDNCTLRDNRSSSMADTVGNTSALTNGSVNTIAETFSADGHYNISIKCWDTSSNSAETVGRTIKVDTTLPIITIISPTNITYSTSSIWFNITLDEAGSWCGYSLDGAANITMTNSSGNWNSQNATMSDESHTATFSCNDTTGNMNSTTVYFTVNACTFPSSGNKTLDLNLNCSYSSETINIDYITFENSGDITFTDSTLTIKGITGGFPSDSRIILFNSSHKTIT